MATHAYPQTCRHSEDSPLSRAVGPRSCGTRHTGHSKGRPADQRRWRYDCAVGGYVKKQDIRVSFTARRTYGGKRGQSNFGRGRTPEQPFIHGHKGLWSSRTLPSLSHRTQIMFRRLLLVDFMSITAQGSRLCT
jgi:hypothetical protein